MEAPLVPLLRAGAGVESAEIAAAAAGTGDTTWVGEHVSAAVEGLAAACAEWAEEQPGVVEAAALALTAAVPPREFLVEAYAALSQSTPLQYFLWLRGALAALGALQDGSARGAKRAAGADAELAAALAASVSDGSPRCLTQATPGEEPTGNVLAMAPPTCAPSVWAAPVTAAAVALLPASPPPTPSRLALVATVFTELGAVSDDGAATAALLPLLTAAAAAGVLPWQLGSAVADAAAAPLPAALAVWVWQEACLATPLDALPPLPGRGVVGRNAQLRGTLQPAGAALRQAGTGALPSAAAGRVLRALARALGLHDVPAAVASSRGFLQRWPATPGPGAGPPLGLQTHADLQGRVPVDAEEEPAVAVVRLLLTLMSTAPSRAARNEGWATARALLCAHRPGARLWLFRVALTACPLPDVAAMLWDGVRACIVAEGAGAGGGEGAFLTPALGGLVRDIVQRRSAAAWSAHAALTDTAPLHAAVANTLRLLLLRGTAALGRGEDVAAADPTGVAAWVAGDKDFDTTYLAHLRHAVAEALAPAAAALPASALTPSAAAPEGAAQLPPLPPGGAVENAALPTGDDEARAALFQLELALSGVADAATAWRTAVAAAS